jgi:flagellin
LGAYVDDVATKDFNGIDLFDGADLDVTTDSDANTYTTTGVDLADAAYTDATGATIETAANAATALTAVQTAIDQVSTDRANIGANISRLSSTNEGLAVQKDNLGAANSRIKDVDVAEESTNFARYNILVQAGTAMLAQANATPQSALRLLS